MAVSPVYGMVGSLSEITQSCMVCEVCPPATGCMRGGRCVMQLQVNTQVPDPASIGQVNVPRGSFPSASDCKGYDRL